MSGRTALVGAVVLATTVLSGCSGNVPASPRTAGDRPRSESYAALGDSFAAAPFVPVTDFAGGCLRSSGNYANRVAATVGAELRDVSCSGARTADILRRQTVAEGHGTVAPQIAAVEPDTDLVTLGIGGNDHGLFGTLVQGCTRLVSDPHGSPCADRLRTAFGDPRHVVERVGGRVAAVLRGVHRAAPSALVVLVGYPRLVDTRRACRAMPLARGDLPLVAELERRLNAVLRRAARSTGSVFLDLRPLSRGHEICSADPWVNGRATDRSRALAYHPFASGQRAVAGALVAVLREQALR